VEEEHPPAPNRAWGSALAWFGSTAGAITWLPVAASVLLIRGEPRVALALIVCFAIPLLAAVRAWNRRDRFDPHSAAETWFVVAWLFSLLAVAAIHASDTHALVNLPGDQIWTMWLVLLLGGPLLWLAIRRRRRQNEAETAALFDVFASWF
jgi:hypothetical protein